MLIRGGRLLDPSIDHDGVADVLLEQGRVAQVGSDLSAEQAEVVDAAGKWVAPGFIDLHVHLREPGQEYKEDLSSGGRAAVAGGFTSICCMANTEPVNDDPAVTKYILDRAAKDSPARIYPIAAATRRLAGEVMTEMSALKEAGAVAFSDDGKTIMDAWVMRNVLEYSKLVDAAVVIHAEDCGLRADGVINEGLMSTRLGLPGNPVEAEEIHVARDIRLARLTGARLHVAHVSSGGSVELIHQAKEAGLSVTAEVTPHHLALTDEVTGGFDTSTKMAPPLRTDRDVETLRAALAEGIIDCVATDHAPHATYEKDVEFTAAPCGILGLETAYGVVNDLVRSGEISPLELMRRMST
ncbi:MAG: dihydroorotase, partial [Myxococcota bacterium]|nr:dihydroorotase [Myxococcota bacterium]